MGPLKTYREEERECATSSGKFNFFPQHIVEGLLNSQRRVSDRPSWILIFKTPARKPTNIAVVIVVLFMGGVEGVWYAWSVRMRATSALFFPQHIVDGLLNSWRRVSDRPSWILISKNPARKPNNIIVIVLVFLFVPRTKRLIF